MTIFVSAPLRFILCVTYILGSLWGTKVFAMGGSQATFPTFYETNPTYWDSVDDSASWRISSPESQGLNSAKLVAAASNLSKQKNLNSFVVVRGDSLVFERYFNGSDRGASNNIHSASKSMLSAAVGIAMERGLIRSPEQPLYELLPRQFAKVRDQAKKRMTLKDLLTMRGGLQWTEDSTEYKIEKKSDWVQAILDLKLESAPGQFFKYSTGMTHLMSAALTEATKKSLWSFVHESLFQKIGIRAEHWGKDPQGYYSGGYNLYLTPREMAKFGLLYVNDGVWNNEQIVPKTWVQESLQKQVNARAGFDYGYNWWIREIGGHKVPFAWGYGGQFIYVIKDLDLVVVITTNTRDFSTEFEGDYILRDYVIPAVVR